MAGQVPNTVRTSRMVRLAIQPGGAGINNRMLLAGVDGGYAMLDAVTRPVRGGIENIPIFNPTGPGYINAGSTESAPSFGSTTLHVRENITGIPLASTMELCPSGVYTLHGSDCTQVTDFTTGYGSGFVRVLPDAKITDNVEYSSEIDYSEDNPLEASIPLTITGDMFDHASIYMAALATATASELATTLTTGVTYGNAIQCGNCGTPNDGTYLKYWCAASTTTSPGGKPGIFYQLGTSTPVFQSVTAAAAQENFNFIGVVGPYLVVGSLTAGGAGIGGYYYSTIGATGVPGSWTKVVTGFQSNKEPTDMLVLSPSEIYFCANGGYIYKSTNITLGVTTNNAGATTTSNLSRIRGNRSLIVATGASGAIIYSTNSANAWASIPASPSWGTPTVQAVDVVGGNIIWVGSSGGQIFASLDRGNSWAEYQFTGYGSGSVDDIYFVTPYEAYFLHTTSGNVGRIFRTYNGGNTWWNQSPAIEQLGSYNALKRIAAPTVGNTTLKCNNVILAGNDTSAKGLLLSGTPQIF